MGFKYSVSLKLPNKKDYAPVIEELEKLGYKSYLFNDFNTYPSLGTSIPNDGHYTDIALNFPPSPPSNREYHTTSSETFLGIAAIRKDDKFYEGEWIVDLKYGTRARILKIDTALADRTISIDGKYREWLESEQWTLGTGRLGKEGEYRKLTPEEIIDLPFSQSSPIEQLTDYIVETKTKEEYIEVLNFLKRTHIKPPGDHNNGAYYTWISKENWDYDDRKEIMTGRHDSKLISFSQWKQMIAEQQKKEEEVFVLPDCWHVKVTRENKQILTSWRDSCYVEVGQIVGMCKDSMRKTLSKEHNPPSSIKGETYDFGIEITFEQFQKYVLNNTNKETMEGRKIIGYKAPSDIPTCEIKKGDILKKAGTGDYKNHYKVGNTCYVANYLPKEIVETWEAVYESPLKAGDYIYFMKSFDGLSPGAVRKISGIIKDSSSENGWINYEVKHTEGGGFRWKDSKSNGYQLGTDFRLATKEEIEKASEQTVNMGSFSLRIKDKKVYHGTEDISQYVYAVKRWWEENNAKTFHTYEFAIKDVVLSKTGCQSVETKVSQWLDVAKKAGL